jgi:hypothetical protein
VRRGQKAPAPVVVGEDVEELLESVENTESEIAEHIEFKVQKEEQEYLSELEIYRGLVAGG